MKLMILDGNSIINRAFYGVRLLTTREGLYTNAIFGFLNILEKLRNEEQPDALAVAFDLKAPTFRHLQYEGYKATRHAMPEELAQQMPLMKDVLRAMNIPIFECEGWEADDILGTAGRICAASDWDCVIVTGDRDSLQLVAEHVSVKLVVTRGGQTNTTLYTPEVFEAEYGFAPIRMIDLKSLMGDSSDNIPGVAGVGPKTATQLLVQYGTLDGVYAHLDELKDSVRKKLEAGRENAYLSYDLATIRCEAPVDFRPEDCLVREADNDALWALFQKLEFSRLAARYHLHPPKPAEPEVYEGECQSEIVTDAARAEALLRQFAEKERVFLLFSADHSSVAVMDDGDTAWLFSRKALGEGYEAFLRGLCAGNIRKVTHDVKETMRFLLGQDLPIEGFCFDTALAGYLLDATQGSYTVDRMFVQYCGSQIGLADEKELGEAAVTANLFARTAAVAALYTVLPAKLEAQGMQELYYDMELPLCAVLALSAFINRALVGFGDTRLLAEGTEFTDFDSFKRYMRKPVKPTYDSGGGFATETAVAESPLYYENDTPIYRSQTEGATIEDDNGNVLCYFIWRNRSVVFWRTGPKADGYLPVTVYTQEAMSLAQQKAKHINMVFYGVYAAEVVAAAAYYLRKREK